MQRFFAFLFLWLAAGSFALPGASSVSAAEPVQIVVKGVEGDALANVRAALKLPAGIVKDNQVNMPWLERFRGQIPGKVHDALVPFGFYDSIAIVEMETEVEGSYILKVNISPGRAVMVTDSEVTIRGPGASENNLLKLSLSFPLKKGDILRQDVYEISKGAIRSAAISLGYLDADFSVHKIFVSKENYSARVVLELETGPRYMFGKASFQDMSGYPEGFLRRYLAFKPGDVFSYDKLSQTHLNLINSDRFSDVVISPRKESAADERVPVEIKLVPSPSKRLKMGVGYGTDTGARFSGQYKDLNILDKGNELAADISLSQRVQGIDTSYTIPGEKIDSSTSFMASFKKEHVTTYRSKQLSLEADRTRSLGGGRLGTAYVRLSFPGQNGQCSSCSPSPAPLFALRKSVGRFLRAGE